MMKNDVRLLDVVLLLLLLLLLLAVIAVVDLSLSAEPEVLKNDVRLLEVLLLLLVGMGDDISADARSFRTYKIQ